MSDYGDDFEELPDDFVDEPKKNYTPVSRQPPPPPPLVKESPREPFLRTIPEGSKETEHEGKDEDESVSLGRPGGSSTANDRS